ncbi:Thioredoxin superfamily protein [Rhynchospora pubera]|uniref:Thioredoxin superfamily protein n=1 Tax=Rhynchospora pubera TaxID=906938 RepID=A0AAV8GLJ4_9POAL|nr:Thioredoxin superfamily protein [Rhynchospora pubera]
MLKGNTLVTSMKQVLLDAANKVGIEGAEELLNDPDKGVAEVNEELEKYSSRISGVPHFTINGKFEISGGQPPEVFQRAFKAAV